jgi:hydrogenase maturation protein HypF
MVDGGFNTRSTTSAGRLFDAISSLLGVRDEVTYEGQAAIELEALAHRGDKRKGPALRLDILERDGGLILDPEPLYTALVQAVLERAETAHLAAAFHVALAGALAAACSCVRDGGGPEAVALCGGVFQNRILTRLTERALESRGLRPILPGRVPINDGGLALGQVMVANAATVDPEEE